MPFIILQYGVMFILMFFPSLITFLPKLLGDLKSDDGDFLLPCFDFAGKTACVTGAASGIGRATATLLADWARSCISPTAIRRDSIRSRRAAGTIKPVVYDQAERSSVEHLASAVGPVDILANNAGIFLYEPLIDLKWDDLERVCHRSGWSHRADTLVGAAMVARRKARSSTPAPSSPSMAPSSAPSTPPPRRESHNS